MHVIAILALSLFAAAPAAQVAPASGSGQRGGARAAARADEQRPKAEDSVDADVGPTYSSLRSVTEFADLIARDERVSFGPGTRATALAEFDRWAPTDAGRAAALMALGCARVSTERSRLESFASEGALELRQAAILALGELRAGDVTLLVELANKRAAVADFALFALVRNGGVNALEAVESIAKQSAHANQAASQDALGFRLNPPVDSPTARAYFELRFEAARRFGLIDDQAWETLLVDDLSRSNKFLSRVIYRAAAGLNRPGIKDHYLELSSDAGVPERLRGVVRAMPTELSLLVEQDLFRPADAREWATLLSEIDLRGLEGMTEPILRRAWLEPGSRASAAALLGRARAPGSLDLLRLGLRDPDPNIRARMATSLASAPSADALPILAGVEHDEDERVRAAAVVAEFRLGSDTAARTLRESLDIDETIRILGEIREAEAKPNAGAGRAAGGRGAAAKAGGRGAGRAGGAGGDKSDGKSGDDGESDGANRAARKERIAKANERLTPLSPLAQGFVEALLPASSDRRVRELLSVARHRVPDGLRLRVDSELALYGDARSRAALREALLERSPRGPTGVRAVYALGRGAGLADLEVLRELFPIGDDVDVDAELACALIEFRDAEVLPILRAALWSDPWNRSVLAGALLISHGGVEALRAELARPPAGVSERDLRRVGFALGEWGGASEVDRLGGRVGAADPALQGALLGALAARTH